MKKKIAVLVAMLALMMFSAVSAFTDENTSEQYVYGSQNAYVGINGDDNSVAVDQYLLQSAFSPVYFYYYPVWVYDPWWGWMLVWY